MSNLDDFTKAYIEAALWSSNDESTPSGGVPLDRNYSVDDIAPETLARMVADCAKFQADNAEWISSEYCLTRQTPDEQAGHDFWLTRNGHGVGFWETSDWAQPASTKLDEASTAFGAVDLYVGDDGKIHGL